MISTNIIEDILFKIHDQEFKIQFNLPWVNLIKLPTSILAGYFVYPSKLELLSAESTETTYEWFGGSDHGAKADDIRWNKIGSGFSLKVDNDLIGHKIKIVCTPKNGNQIGPSAEQISKGSVEAGPGVCPFETRHLFTPIKLTGRTFRTVTYNLLADLYTDSDYSRETLFPYCPPYALSMDYRKQLLIKELLGYNSDIICLQEVDAKIFDHDLQRLFSELNYQGTYQPKGNTAEGLAMFFNANRFSLVEKFGLTIGEHIEQLPVFEELWRKIESNVKLMDRIRVRSTAIQVTVVRSIEFDKILVVANTHLYFHPDADHIRLLQIGFSMLYVKHVYDKIKSDLQLINDANISIVFCGDFNSVPECGIFKLMTEKLVGPDFIDFKSSKFDLIEFFNLVLFVNDNCLCFRFGRSCSGRNTSTTL